jgi:putative membrane protein
MKTCRNSMTHLVRVVKTGAAVGAAIFAASALQAQDTGQSPTAPPAASIETPAKISHRAKDFLQDAAQANQMEITLADVALEKSQNSDVRDLAQTLRTDHQLNYAQLQAIARPHGVKLDAALTWPNRRTVNRLQKSNDRDFDKEYTVAMMKDHVACIKTFDKASAELGEPDVKVYAQNTLPALRGHLMRSEKAARSAGVDEVTISSILKGLPMGEDERRVTFNQE